MRVAQLAGDEESSDKSRTFVFQDEGHTLGNALRCIISSYPHVQFCGYTVPHPAESKMHFRIQVRSGKAIDTLKKGLEDLVQLSDHTLEKFEHEMNAFKTASPIRDIRLVNSNYENVGSYRTIFNGGVARAHSGVYNLQNEKSGLKNMKKLFAV